METVSQPSPSKSPANGMSPGLPKKNRMSAIPWVVRVSQVDEPVRLPVETRSVHPVTVPVAHHREVTRVAIQEAVGDTTGATQMPHPRRRVDQTDPIGHLIGVDGQIIETDRRFGSLRRRRGSRGYRAKGRRHRPTGRS